VRIKKDLTGEKPSVKTAKPSPGRSSLIAHILTSNVGDVVN